MLRPLLIDEIKLREEVMSDNITCDITWNAAYTPGLGLVVNEGAYCSGTVHEHQGCGVI